MWTIIGTKRLNHMRRFAIATLTSMNSKVFYSHLIDLTNSIMCFWVTNTNAANLLMRS